MAHHSSLKTQKILSLLVVLVLVFSPIQSASAENGSPNTHFATTDPVPVLLKDIYTADASSDPYDFFAYGDLFFYQGYDPAHGYELWVSNGTDAGTSIVADIISGADSSNPGNFTVFREKLFFSIAPDYNGQSHGLWFTDGVPGHATNVYTTPWECSYQENELVPLGDWLYFTCGNRLMRYGGPQNQVENNLPSFSIGSTGMVLMNGVFYFTADNGTLGSQLYRYDPSAAGAQPTLVKGICPDVCSSYNSSSGPTQLTRVENKLFFKAYDQDHGGELWVTDGSEAGTHLVKDINPGIDWTDFSSLVAAGGWLYFTADDGTHGRELWRSDGTSENTTLVADLAPGALSSMPSDLAVVDQGGSQAIYLSARDALPGEGHGVELWRLPVTPAGETAEPVVFEIAAGASSSLPKDMRAIGDTVYFSAQDQPGNIELWKAAASPDTLTQVADMVPGADGSTPQQLAAWNGKLLFSAVDAVNGREPWISDGTTAGPRMISNTVKDVDEIGSRPSAGLLTKVGGLNIRYFTARDALHGDELWRTDGTLAGTYLVKDIDPGPSSSFMYGRSMAEMGGILYFRAINSESGENLWRSDGTAVGTWMVKDIDPDEFYSYPDQLTVAGNRLYFTAYDALDGEELWSSDGTAGGTYLLKDITPGSQYPYDRSLVALNDQLIFVVIDTQQNFTYELWRSDGTLGGTKAFYGPFTPAQGFYTEVMTSFYAAGKQLYFNMNIEDANPEINGDRLWMTDGTTAGTVKVKTPNNQNLYSPALLTPTGNTLYFAAKAYPSAQSTLWTLPLGSGTTNPAYSNFNGTPRFMGFLNDQKLMIQSLTIPTADVMLYTLDLANGTTQYVCYNNCFPESIQSPIIWSGKLYFIDSSSDEETPPSGLWVTDGTQSGTRYLPIPATGLPFKSPKALLYTVKGLYFTANDGQHGSEPWFVSYDGGSQVTLPMIAKGQ